jgi:hypothetical protein
LGFLLLAAALAVLASCASTADLDRQDSASLAALLEAGDATRLAAASSLPFAVDQETLVLPADLSALWAGLCKAGLRVVPASGDRPASEPAGPEGWRRFADTMDMRMFFARQVPKDARLLELRTGDGRRLLLVAARPAGQLRLYGIKGPH